MKRPFPALTGIVAPGFEPVRDTLVANFEEGLELGAALAVYQRGKPVVDLASGLRDPKSGEPYSTETLQPVFSATKGITALAANNARGSWPTRSQRTGRVVLRNPPRPIGLAMQGHWPGCSPR